MSPETRRLSEREELERALGLDDTLAVGASDLKIRIVQRRYGKSVTLIEGFDAATDVKAVARDLKQKLGTGGTSKDDVIELQGEHAKAARDYLSGLGYHVG